jgi:hypothetical protein
MCCTILFLEESLLTLRRCRLVWFPAHAIDEEQGEAGDNNLAPSIQIQISRPKTTTDSHTAPFRAPNGFVPRPFRPSQPGGPSTSMWRRNPSLLRLFCLRHAWLRRPRMFLAWQPPQLAIPCRCTSDSDPSKQKQFSLTQLRLLERLIRRRRAILNGSV